MSREQPQRSYKTSLPSVTPMRLNMAWQGTAQLGRLGTGPNAETNLGFLAVVDGQALGSHKNVEALLVIN